MPRPKLLAVLSLALAAHPAAAQIGPEPHVPVGSPQVRTAHLVNRVDSLVLLVDRVDPFPVGSMVIATTLASDAGRETVLRVETVHDAEGKLTNVDSSVVLRGSLAPLAYTTRQGARRKSMTFADGRVRGEEVSSRGVRKPLDTPLPGQAFAAPLMDLLLGSLPLREGYAARFPVYDPDRGMASTTVHVAELETVRTADGGSCRAWRVSVAGGGAPGTYWIEEHARTLVRFERTGSPLRVLRRQGCAARPVPHATR